MRTKTLLTIGGIGVAGYLLYKWMNKGKGSSNFAGFTFDERFANLTSAPQGCTFYAGSTSAPNGTVLQGWGTRGGVIVNNGATTGQTLVCPVGQSRTMPSR